MCFAVFFAVFCSPGLAVVDEMCTCESSGGATVENGTRQIIIAKRSHIAALKPCDFDGGISIVIRTTRKP